ncbi:MAG: phosphatidate cytidylyltransferase [Bacteroidota bacterium]
MPEPIPFRSELSRKALHLLTLAIPAGLLVLGRDVALWVLVPLAAVAVLADVLRVHSAGFKRFIDRFFGFMMRADEQPELGDPVRINGATWVLVASALTAVLFPVELAAPALALFLVGDAAAALVGRRFGKHEIGSLGKSWEGSLAFVLAGGLAAWAFAPALSPVALIAASLVGALAEAIPRPFNDNLRVPIAAGVVLALLA